MPHVFKLPDLGEGVESGDVINLHVKQGDTVEKDQPLMEIESGKATLDLPSPVAGTISELHVKTGATVKPGQEIATIEESDGGRSEDESESENTGEDEGASDETKQKPEKKASSQGKQATDQDDAQATDTDDDGQPAERQQHDSTETSADEQGRAAPERPTDHGPLGIPAAPSVRQLARELGVDLAALADTAQGGRITEADVRAAAGSGDSGKRTQAAAGQSAAPAEKSPHDAGTAAGEPMNSVRKLTAATVARAWREVPHVFQQVEADVTETEARRSTFNREHGAHVTMTALSVRALCLALEDYPLFNASVDMEHMAIVHHQRIDVGIAMDTARGLVAPVLRDAGAMRATTIADTLRSLAGRARDGALDRAAYADPTISISNLGPIGGGHFTPIVIPPQVATLGLGRTRTLPRYRQDGLFPRAILPVTLSYDHRAIDGADGARFALAFAEIIGDPQRVLPS